MMDWDHAFTTKADSNWKASRIRKLEADRFKMMTALRAIAAMKHPDEPPNPLKEIAKNVLQEIGNG